MSKPYTTHASPANQPHPRAPRPRRGFRIAGPVLYFEDVAIADLEQVRGGFATWRDRVVQYVDDLDGHPDPAGEITELRDQVRYLEDG